MAYITDTQLAGTGIGEGAALVGFKHPSTVAVARTVQQKAVDTLSVKDFGAVGDGSANDTAAFTLAIAALPASGGTIFVPIGTYKVTSTIDVGTKGNVVFRGDGRGASTGGASTILFAPTADDTLFHFGGGTSPTAQNGLYDLSLISNDAEHAKIAVHLEDCSEFRFENCNIGGVQNPGLYNYWFGGIGGSIGIKTNGRDMMHVLGNRIAAQRPMVWALNPNHPIAADSFKIFGNYFQGSGGTEGHATAYPIIQLIGKGGATAWATVTSYRSGDVVSNAGTVYVSKVDHTSGVFATDLAAGKWVAAPDFLLSNVNIADNNFIGGSEVFRWDDPANALASNDLVFGATNRVEQTHDLNAYEVYLNANMRNVSFSHWYGGADNADAKNGLYFRNVDQLSLRDWSYVGTSGTKNALNVDSTVNNIVGSNCLVSSGAAVSITGQRFVRWGGSYPTANVPNNFELQTTAVAVGTIKSDYWQTGSLITVPQDATHTICSNANSGMLMITNSQTISAIFMIIGGNNLAFEMSDPAGHYSATKDTASSTNIYQEGGNYILQNKRGAEVKYRIVLIGPGTLGFTA